MSRKRVSEVMRHESLKSFPWEGCHSRHPSEHVIGQAWVNAMLPCLPEGGMALQDGANSVQISFIIYLRKVSILLVVYWERQIVPDEGRADNWAKMPDRDGQLLFPISYISKILRCFFCTTQEYLVTDRFNMFRRSRITRHVHIAMQQFL